MGESGTEGGLVQSPESASMGGEVSGAMKGKIIYLTRNTPVYKWDLT